VGIQGTVLIQNAKELTDYSRSEEDKLAQLIQGVADSGATVVVAGAAIGEMAMHFIEKHGIMAIRCVVQLCKKGSYIDSGVTLLTGMCPRHEGLVDQGPYTVLRLRSSGRVHQFVPMKMCHSS
jgi:hypothetical protein